LPVASALPDDEHPLPSAMRETRELLPEALLEVRAWVKNINNLPE
jgi:hypothetical protein